jgi:hypothetical protein
MDEKTKFENMRHFSRWRFGFAAVPAGIESKPDAIFGNQDVAVRGQNAPPPASGYAEPLGDIGSQAGARGPRYRPALRRSPFGWNCSPRAKGELPQEE